MTAFLQDHANVVVALLAISACANFVLFMLWRTTEKQLDYSENFILYLAGDVANGLLSVDAYNALIDEAGAIEAYRWEKPDA